VRWTLLALLGLLLLLVASPALAAPPVDPPLTYRLTIYGNDRSTGPGRVRDRAWHRQGLLLPEPILR